MNKEAITCIPFIVTLRKFKEGYFTHSTSKNVDIRMDCWFEATVKWMTETPESINIQIDNLLGLEQSHKLVRVQTIMKGLAIKY